MAVEDATNRGRLDMAVVLDGSMFLLEFKVVDRAAGSARRQERRRAPGPRGRRAGPASHTDSAALPQSNARRYADKYRAPGRTVHLIGVETGAATLDITAFDVESG